MMRTQSKEADSRAQAARELAALRGPLFRFKPQWEAFLEETFRAVARLPD